MRKKAIIATCVFAAIGAMIFLTPVKTYLDPPKVTQSTIEPLVEDKEFQTIETIMSPEDFETKPKIEVIREIILETEAATEEVVSEEDIDSSEVTINDGDYDLVYLGEFKFTAYCPCPECCGIYSSGYTATGTWATEGRTIAVDPTVIPYGSKVLINGHIYIAEDCGGAIKGNRIDMFFNDHNEANIFGIKYFDVYLIREG